MKRYTLTARNSSKVTIITNDIIEYRPDPNHTIFQKVTDLVDGMKLYGSWHGVDDAYLESEDGDLWLELSYGNWVLVGASK